MKPCMDPPEAAEWQRLNDILPPVNRAADPCEDCTVRFAVQMRLVGRCDSWPYDRVGGRPWSPSADDRQERRREQWRDAQFRRRQRARATA